MWSVHQGSQTWTPSSTFQVVPFFGFFISDFIFENFFQVFLCVLETFLSDTENNFCHFVDFENFASRIFKLDHSFYQFRESIQNNGTRINGDSDVGDNDILVTL